VGQQGEQALQATHAEVVAGQEQGAQPARSMIQSDIIVVHVLNFGIRPGTC
jgi:hypothetical protein